ncbi:anthranilate synthase component I family protein [Microbacterium sp. 5K110]|uniref:anthranilate synthase component I family protein n=1 Tax=unclassified Microbacterium TaxID=2609290 RepID=UPI0010FDDAAC|nr:anthranilate synthase component I family protein [Microbacterium sp. 5K110]TLF34402.1 anthranilate synthase component I family protein [Microbacterium sp. 5K110]
MPRSLSTVALPRWREPDDVFCALFADEPHAFWLDAGPDASTGWSYLGAGRPDTAGSPRNVDATIPPPPGISGPDFRGGWVGWVSYEGAPAWLRVEELLAFDHASRRVWALSSTGSGGSLAAAGADAPRAATPPIVEGRGVASARHSPEEYAGLIGACRERIADGDAYQLCLTTRFTVPGTVDALAAFRRLRIAASSHHGGFLRLGDTTLVSASPERFLEVRGGRVHTHPIKGTRPRHPDPERDAALADDLRSDAKERAENVMIVDLMRNDLSRVCVPSSVGVDRLLEVETYPTVHQLVSEVSGALRPATTIGDLLDAAFPAGSMTGAPKASAREILAGLEGAERGVYSGTFGWVGDDGAADLAMVIRSIVVEPDAAWVGAGGGITWRSVVASEVAEVGIKARAPLAALGAAVPPGW